MLIVIIGVFFLFHCSRNKRKAYNKRNTRNISVLDNYALEKQRRDEKARILYQKQQRQQMIAIEKQRQAGEKKRQAAEKRRQQKEEASSDLKYYISRMDNLQEMIWVIDFQLEIARKNIETDKTMNEYGAVISEKTVKAHSEEYTKLQKQALTIENQIHALEKKIARAQYILAS